MSVLERAHCILLSIFFFMTQSVIGNKSFYELNLAVLKILRLQII